VYTRRVFILYRFAAIYVYRHSKNILPSWWRLGIYILEMISRFRLKENMTYACVIACTCTRSQYCKYIFYLLLLLLSTVWWEFDTDVKKTTTYNIRVTLFQQKQTQIGFNKIKTEFKQFQYISYFYGYLLFTSTLENLKNKNTFFVSFIV
jgi:hypothetical protein